MKSRALHIRVAVEPVLRENQADIRRGRCTYDRPLDASGSPTRAQCGLFHRFRESSSEKIIMLLPTIPRVELFCIGTRLEFDDPPIHTRVDIPTCEHVSAASSNMTASQCRERIELLQHGDRRDREDHWNQNQQEEARGPPLLRATCRLNAMGRQRDRVSDYGRPDTRRGTRHAFPRSGNGYGHSKACSFGSPRLHIREQVENFVAREFVEQSFDISEVGAFFARQCRSA